MGVKLATSGIENRTSLRLDAGHEISLIAARHVTAKGTSLRRGSQSPSSLLPRWSPRQ